MSQQTHGQKCWGPRITWEEEAFYNIGMPSPNIFLKMKMECPLYMSSVLWCTFCYINLYTPIFIYIIYIYIYIKKIVFWIGKLQLMMNFNHFFRADYWAWLCLLFPWHDSWNDEMGFSRGKNTIWFWLWFPPK